MEVEFEKAVMNIDAKDWEETVFPKNNNKPAKRVIKLRKLLFASQKNQGLKYKKAIHGAESIRIKHYSADAYKKLIKPIDDHSHSHDVYTNGYD